MSARCVVPRSDGTDCPGGVDDDAPLDVCWQHAAVIAVWVNDTVRVADPPRRLLAPCPGCNVKTLVHRRKSETITCDNCGTRWNESEHPELLVAAPARGHPLLRVGAPPVVYYLQFGNRIKIGTTTSLRNRLASLPPGELLAVEPGSIGRERQRHREFRGDRIAGEWFADTPALREHIRQLRAEHGDPHAA